jgi:hypothetical protein
LRLFFTERYEKEGRKTNLFSHYLFNQELLFSEPDGDFGGWGDMEGDARVKIRYFSFHLVLPNQLHTL